MVGSVADGTQLYNPPAVTIVATGRLNAYGSESTGGNLFLSLAEFSEVIALEIGWGFNHRLFLADGC
jgi:hypothetical protein